MTHALGPTPGKATCGALLGLSRIAGQAGAVLDCPDCVDEERRQLEAQQEVKRLRRLARRAESQRRRRAVQLRKWRHIRRCEVAECWADCA